MGGVLDGQAVNAAVTNPAFINKNSSDVMPFTLDFTDPTTSSGSSIHNIQKNINAIASTLGIPVDQVYNYIRAWTNNNFGTTSDTAYARIEAIDAAFSSLSGAYTFRAGSTTLANAVSTMTITFTNAFTDNNYSITWSIENTADAAPIQLQGWITSRLTTGFVLTLAVPTDSTNYTIHWSCRRYKS